MSFFNKLFNTDTAQEIVSFNFQQFLYPAETENHLFKNMIVAD